jgi:hypothetical protein
MLAFQNGFFLVELLFVCLLAGWSVDRMVCLFGWLVACLLASEYR